MCCELKIGAANANLLEHAKTMTLGDVFDHMQHKRRLVIGILFKPELQVSYDYFTENVVNVMEESFFSEAPKEKEEGFKKGKGGRKQKANKTTKLSSCL